MSSATKTETGKTAPQKPSDPNDVKSLIAYFDDQIFNQNNLKLADELVDDGFVSHTPLPGQPPDKAGVLATAKSFREAFPDWHLDNQFIMGEGDTVAHRILWSGTHVNEYLGFKPTGKKIEVASYDFNRFKDGKMIERWSVFDTQSFLQQLAGGKDAEAVRQTGGKAMAAFSHWALTGEAEQFLDFLTDDATLVFYPAPEGLSTPQSGKEAIAAYLNKFNDLQLRVKHEPKTAMVSGDSYAVELNAKGTLNGQPREIQLLEVFDISDGKVTAVREYGV